MKGFMKDGKFHPITDYKGVRKSRDQKAKSAGVKIRNRRESANEVFDHFPAHGKSSTKCEDCGKVYSNYDFDTSDDALREFRKHWKTHNRKAREVIYQDDPQAIPKLEKKLEDLEKQRAYWKTVKKTVPRDYSATEGDRKWFMPQLISANIRTVKKKIEKIKDRNERGVGLERKTTFKGGRKVFYYEEVEPVGKVRQARGVEINLMKVKFDNEEFLLTKKGFNKFQKEADLLASKTRSTEEGKKELKRNIKKLAIKHQQMDKPMASGEEITLSDIK